MIYLSFDSNIILSLYVLHVQRIDGLLNQLRGCLNQHFKLLHIHVAIWLIQKIKRIKRWLWNKHNYHGKLFISLDWIFDEYSKSKLLASLNQFIGYVYDDLAYDEDSHLHCLEPTQHSWVLDPNYIKAQVVKVRKATWPPPWSHLVHLQNHDLASREPTPLHPGKWALCALWTYLLGFVNRMAIKGIDKPP